MRNITAFLAVLTLSGCETIDQVRDTYRDSTPWETYVEALGAAGLQNAALTRDWVAAGGEALDAPLPVGLPFREETFITPEQPRAIAYRVALERGRKLTVSVNAVGEGTEPPARIFVDFLRVPSDSLDPLRPVLSTDSLPWHFEYEPWRGGEFVIRVQPELLRGGRFTVVLDHEAQLAFPVEGRDMDAILSVFGASRDGGRRRHHGVDIFARRGTPVLAASAGRTYRVSDTEIGGKVVWVRDTVRQASIYYAHLDSQKVGNDEWVEPGDTVGFVGNTGNARTTPPHLHFGLYRRGDRNDPDRGPVDPVPFLEPPPGRLSPDRRDGSLLGSWVQLTGGGVDLRATPSGTVLEQLEPSAMARVLATTTQGRRLAYRVELIEGRVGYLSVQEMEHLVQVAARPAVVDRSRPAAGSTSGSTSEGGTRD